MLEVIQSDFARLETDTKAAEAEAQRSYDEFSTESAVNRAQNVKDVEHKTTKKTNEESALNTKKADLEGTQKELDAALAYYEKLKPSCVDAGVSYEDRVTRRQEEIQCAAYAFRAGSFFRGKRSRSRPTIPLAAGRCMGQGRRGRHGVAFVRRFGRVQ